MTKFLSSCEDEPPCGTQEFLGGKVVLRPGDCREVLRGLADCSIDSVVTDPPYALVSIQKRFANSPRNAKTENVANPYGRTGRGFMGQKWDTGETAFAAEFWAEVLRVLKPGGHVVAFSGTRTYHRMACAIEDAGFEIRDQLAWAYGSGFPKSHDVSKAIDKAAGHWRGRAGEVIERTVGQPSKGTEYERADKGDPITPAAQEWQGWGTALKPAWEPICLARKPLIGTVAENVLEHGTGAINVDGCRIHAEDAQGGEYTVKRLKPGATLDKTGGNWRPEDGPEYHGTMKPGRWPANIVHDGSDEVVGFFPRETGKSAGNATGNLGYHGGAQGGDGAPVGFGDSGSAARYFYCAKPDDPRPRFVDHDGNPMWCEQCGEAWGEISTEHALLCQGCNIASLEEGAPDISGSRLHYTAKADAEDRLGSKHPTVKPVDLMQWLVRLVCPRGGTVLDPFAGTGTTGEAAWREGCRAVLVEREEEYRADIVRRMELTDQGPEGRRYGRLKDKQEAPETLPLFGANDNAPQKASA